MYSWVLIVHMYLIVLTISVITAGQLNVKAD